VRAARRGDVRVAAKVGALLRLGRRSSCVRSDER
jgi:hypothetical protein